MRLVVRPIRYTSRLHEMRAWATRLGLVVLLDTDDWVVLGAGAGRLALHAVAEGDPFAGTTTLAFETDDLDALADRWRAAGIETRRVEDAAIPLLLGTTPFGGEMAAGTLSPAPADGATPDPGLRVMPMLVTRDVPAAGDWFATWGLARRISGERGGWVDLEVPDGGGLVAVHGADDLASEPPVDPPAAPGSVREVGVGLTFEHDDADALLERLRAAGLDDAHVVDESYNRTLLTRCPDGDTIWVNGAMTDLYGYRLG